MSGAPSHLYLSKEAMDVLDKAGHQTRNVDQTAGMSAGETVCGAVGWRDLPRGVLQKIGGCLPARDAAAAFIAAIPIFDALDAVTDHALIRKLNKLVGQEETLTLLQAHASRLAQVQTLRLPDPRYTWSMDSRGYPACEETLKRADKRKEAALQTVVWSLLRGATGLREFSVDYFTPPDIASVTDLRRDWPALQKVDVRIDEPGLDPEIPLAFFRGLPDGVVDLAFTLCRGALDLPADGPEVARKFALSLRLPAGLRSLRLWSQEGSKSGSPFNLLCVALPPQLREVVYDESVMFEATPSDWEQAGTSWARCRPGLEAIYLELALPLTSGAAGIGAVAFARLPPTLRRLSLSGQALEMLSEQECCAAAGRMPRLDELHLVAAACPLSQLRRVVPLTLAGGAGVKRLSVWLSTDNEDVAALQDVSWPDLSPRLHELSMTIFVEDRAIPLFEAVGFSKVMVGLLRALPPKLAAFHLTLSRFTKTATSPVALSRLRREFDVASSLHFGRPLRWSVDLQPKCFSERISVELASFRSTALA